MTCICGYEWCWTCGFSKDSWLHKVQWYDSWVCNFINSFLYGFELQIHLHWTIRLLFFLIGLAFSPLIILLLLLWRLMTEMHDISWFNNEASFCYQKHNIIVFLIVVWPSMLVYFVFSLVVSIILSVVFTSVVIVCSLLALLILLPIMLYRSF